MTQDFTDIYYAFVDKLEVEKYFDSLPKIRAEKAKKLKVLEKQQCSVGVYLLLCKALEKYGINAKNYELKYDKYGKPYLIDCPLYFSLAHSGNCVAVAISNKPVGVDVEVIKDFDYNVRQYVFTEKDEKDFQNTIDKVDCFYEKWTKKEAQYKLDLRAFKGDYDDPFYNFKIKEKYMFAVAPNKPTKIEEITI